MTLASWKKRAAQWLSFIQWPRPLPWLPPLHRPQHCSKETFSVLVFFCLRMGEQKQTQKTRREHGVSRKAFLRVSLASSQLASLSVLLCSLSASGPSLELPSDRRGWTVAADGRSPPKAQSKGAQAASYQPSLALHPARLPARKPGVKAQPSSKHPWVILPR